MARDRNVRNPGDRLVGHHREEWMSPAGEGPGDLTTSRSVHGGKMAVTVSWYQLLKTRVNKHHNSVHLSADDALCSCRSWPAVLLSN